MFSEIFVAPTAYDMVCSFFSWSQKWCLGFFLDWIHAFFLPFSWVWMQQKSQDPNNSVHMCVFCNCRHSAIKLKPSWEFRKLFLMQKKKKKGKNCKLMTKLWRRKRVITTKQTWEYFGKKRSTVIEERSSNQKTESEGKN